MFLLRWNEEYDSLISRLAVYIIVPFNDIPFNDTVLAKDRAFLFASLG